MIKRKKVKNDNRSKIQLTSTEIGTVLIAYQTTSATLLLFDLFKEKTITNLSDLHLKFATIAKHIFDFSKKGGKIMIKHRWMEEPPQMEDRNQLTK